MTTGINGDNGNTCSAYWSKVFRNKCENLQDTIAPWARISKVEKKKRVNILKKIIKSKDLAPLKKNLKNHRKKISVTFLEKWDPSKKHLKTNCSLGTVKLTSFKKLFSETKKVKERHREIRKLKNKLISSESAARKLASKLK